MFVSTRNSRMFAKLLAKASFSLVVSAAIMTTFMKSSNAMQKDIALLPSGYSCPGGPGGDGMRLGPATPAAIADGGVIIRTGALHIATTDLTIPAEIKPYIFSRCYNNMSSEEPGDGKNYKLSLGNNWAACGIDTMRLTAKKDEKWVEPPKSIIVCYDISVEREFNKISDKPLKYGADDQHPDLSDEIFLKTIDGTEYWVLKKISGLKYCFYPPNMVGMGGKLKMVLSVSDSVLFNYDTMDNGKPYCVVDSFGNTVVFSYYATTDNRNGLLKKIEWTQGGASVDYSFDEQANLARVTISENNERSTWLYAYRKDSSDLKLKNNLLYVVDPYQYEQMCELGVKDSKGHFLSCEDLSNGSVVHDPDFTQEGSPWTWDDFAPRQYSYIETGEHKGKVAIVTYSSGQEISYTHREKPAADIATEIVATHSGGVVMEQGVDDLGRLRYMNCSNDTVKYSLDARGRITSITRPDGRRLLLVYRTEYDPDKNIQSGDATTFPSYEVVEYEEDGKMLRRVIASYTFCVPGYDILPATMTLYKIGDKNNLDKGIEGEDKVTIHYVYYPDGSLKYEAQPLVRNGILPGESQPKAYRLGVEYEYSKQFPGQVVSETLFTCESFEGDCMGPAKIVGRINQMAYKYEFHSTGVGRGMIHRKTIVEDDGKTSITTEYQYDDSRRISKIITDPDNQDESSNNHAH